MARWQRSARFGIAIFAVVFAVFVGRQLKRRDPPPVAAPVARTDPGAVVETTGGKMLRFDRERAAIQREIDRLQELGATQHGHEIDNLWQRKKDLLHRIEGLT